MKKSPGLFIVLPVFIIAAAAVFWFAVRREAPSATGGTAGAPAGIPTAAAAQAAPDALAAGTGASAGTATASAAATPSASGATGGIDAAAATAGGTAVATPAAAQRLADTNPGFADALAQARKGDLFALVLPGGRRVSGTVNVATLRPDGTRYVGGKLDGWRRATFFFSLNAGRTPGGHVLVFDDERAFVIAAAAPAGAAAAPDAAASAVAAAPAAADLVWQEKHLGEVICHPYPAAPDDHHHSAAATAVSTSGAPGAPSAAAAAAGTPAAASVTSAASSASSAAAPAAIPASAGSAAPRVARSDPVPAYESRPGASVVVLLDFDGAIVEDAAWNAEFCDGDPIVAAPSSLLDDDIGRVWRRVSEDYAPFNINITTDPAAYARADLKRRIRCIITPTKEWYGDAGGVAYVGAMGWDSEMYPCWVFNVGYDGIAEAASHEIGHTFSLEHDGVSSPDSAVEYYDGHGTAPMRWGAIMGSAYGKDIAQWSKNEYHYGVNMAGLKDPTVISGTQDDIALIANYQDPDPDTLHPVITGYANDGIGGTADTAAPIAISGTDFVPQTGIITSSDDVNYHRLVLPAPRTVTLRATPAAPEAAVPEANIADLNIALTLAADDGTPIITFGTGNTVINNSTFATLSATGAQFLDSGTYFIKIAGCGFKIPATDGFSAYGSIGRYTLSGAIDAPFTDAPDVPDDPGALAITAQPTGAALAWSGGTLAPSPLILSVTTAGGAAPLAHLWHKDSQPLADATRADGGALSGATAGTLVIDAPAPSDAGGYHVLVTDAAGRTVASETATVTVAPPAAPVITAQPVDFVTDGPAAPPAAATFTVTATSAAPLHYQWLKNGTPLTESGRYTGVTTGTLVIGELADDDNQPWYHARVTSPGAAAPAVSGSARIVFAQLIDYRWAAAGAAAWETSANWSSGFVPTGTSAIYISNGGTAVIATAGGDAAVSGTAILGDAAGQSGAVLLTGSGQWNIGEHPLIGNRGAGRLIITDNAAVRAAGHGYAAFQPGGSGEIIISGSGLFDSGTHLYIGYSSSGTARLALSDDARVTASGTYFQNAVSTLAIAPSAGRDAGPYVTAHTATLGGALVVTHAGFPAGSPPLATGTIIHTTGGGISGSFASVSFAGGTALPDYLAGVTLLANGGADYVFTHTLAWQLAGPGARGDFTIPAGGTYTVPVSLADNLSGTSAAWDGKTLSKYGPGTLVLGETNTYTGTTAVHAGALTATGTLAGPVVNSATLTAASVAGPVANHPGATLLLAPGDAHRFDGALANHGTLDFASPDAGPYRTLTVASLDGAGALRMKFNPAAAGAGDADRLVILGDAAGVHTLDVTLTGAPPPAGLPELPLLTVGGANNATITGRIVSDDIIYTLTPLGGGGTLAFVRSDTVAGYRWTATGAAAWETSANWSGGRVPAAGTDTIYITNGGTAVIGDTTIATKGATILGEVAGESGAVNVSGNGRWESDQDLTIGRFGAGRLAITGHSYMINRADSIIGDYNTATGEVIISGSSWWQSGETDTGGKLTIGRSGAGRLAITDRGTVVNHAAGIIAANYNATGEVTLGGGGLWNSIGGLAVGGGGADATGTLAIAENARVTTAGAYAQNAASTLVIVPSAGRDAGPHITAGAATLDGTLIIDNLAATGTLLHTTGGTISGSFASVCFDPAGAAVDYLSGITYLANGNTDYVFDHSLSWHLTGSTAHGNFTIPAGATYTIPVSLADNLIHTNTAWDGKTLSKYGPGTLVLHETNSYTGTTANHEGTLAATGTLAGPVANHPGATLLLAGTATLRFAGALDNRGLLDFGAPDPDDPDAPAPPYRTLTVASLAGTGTLRMKFDPAAPAADRLVVLGAASGSHTVNVTLAGAGAIPPGGLPPLPLFTIAGGNSAAITGSVTAGGFTYTLQRLPGPGGAIAFIRATPADFYWTAPAAAAWDSPANWDAALVPSVIDTIHIANGGTAVISGTAAAASGTAFLGENPGQSGAVAIGGTARWDSGVLLVGAAPGAPGSLALVGGATVRALSTQVAAAPGGSGEITLTGSAHLDAGAALRAGPSGTARLALADDARVTATGAYTQNALSTLAIAPSAARAAATPYITAQTATLAGTLVIENLAAPGTIIRTAAAAGITGAFDRVEINDTTGLDYLTGTTGFAADGKDYILAHALAWQLAGPAAHGDFTIATGTYTVPVPLADNPSGTSAAWDGRSLSKYGPGALVLSETNTYTGTTTVHEGALTATGTLAGPVVNSATLAAARLAGPVTNHPGATLLLAGGATPRFDGALLNHGTLDFDSPPAGPYRTLTLGALAGSGTLRMTIVPADGSGDRLLVLGDTSGTHTLDLTVAGAPPDDSDPPLDPDALRDLLDVQGSNGALFTGSFVYGVFIYTLQQPPGDPVTLHVTGFNPNLGCNIEPALQTVVAGRRLSLEARGLNGNPDPRPPLVWQRRATTDASWTTLSATTSRLWIDNITPALNNASYRYIAQGLRGSGTSLPATLRVIPETTEPAALAAATGTLYLANPRDHHIQKITLGLATAGGVATSLAGAPGQPGSTDATGTAARFRSPAGIALANGTLYIADTANHTIRKLTPGGAVTTLAGAPGEPGSANGPALDARFHSPQAIALSATGDLYIADTENHAIRKLTPDGAVTTLGAGTPGGTTLLAPRGLALDDTRRRLYIADADTHAIYATDLAPGPDGDGRILRPLAGEELDADIRDALSDAARFNAPWGLATTPNGDLYIADHANAALRKLTPATGAVTTLILTAAGGSGTGGNNNNNNSTGGGGNTTSAGGGAPLPAPLLALLALLLLRARAPSGRKRE